jgi:hypothetical protein
MEKTEPNIVFEKAKEQEQPSEFFLEKPFDEEEHFEKLKNKSTSLLDSQNQKTFKTIHFFYDETCKENETFSEKKIEKITWSSNLLELKHSKEK